MVIFYVFYTFSDTSFSHVKFKIIFDEEVIVYSYIYQNLTIRFEEIYIAQDRHCQNVGSNMSHIAYNLNL